MGESNSDAQELLSEDGITQSVNQTFNTTVHEGNIMEDNTISKLRVSRAEASEKIQDQINKGEKLTEISATSKDDLTNLKHESRRWCDYNKTLFETLFDISPLRDSHGVSWGRMVAIAGHDYTADDIKDHKKDIISWCNELQSILEQLDLYEELPNNTQQPMNNDAVNNENKKIFIGHGGSHIWRELKDFIVETLGLEYEEFNRISAVGKPTSERLKEMLEESSIAIIIMTGEDEQADGSFSARDNVIHEIGLFQGKLGFEQTIILLEDGCKDFSNIHGITHIPFPKGEIEATFGHIFKDLKQKSMT